MNHKENEMADTSPRKHSPNTVPGSKSVNVSLAPDLYAKFEKLAQEDDRTLSNYLSRELAGKNVRPGFQRSNLQPAE
jgi:hypothetical protein